MVSILADRLGVGRFKEGGRGHQLSAEVSARNHVGGALVRKAPLHHLKDALSLFVKEPVFNTPNTF